MPSTENLNTKTATRVLQKSEVNYSRNSSTQKTKGLRIERIFTKAGEDPFDSVRWEKRISRIFNERGNVVHEMNDVEMPAHWSQVAVDIMASKYFRRAGVPKYGDHGKQILDENGNSVTIGETSAKQVISRLTSCWRWWGEQHGYFASEKDAEVFEDELKYMMVHQMAAPNSPQWFNTGLAHSYGITGPAQGHWYVDPKTEELKESEDAYTHPQPHACFIQAVKDSLIEPGGIMDLVTREARVFKYGSGTGTNFSSLREAGAPLSGGGKSSGLMSWLKIFDRAAGAIKSGGTTRRAAKMVILDVDHPDIEEFVWWKAREEKKVAALVAAGYPSDFNGEAYGTVSGQNSNNTVRVSNEFMEAVEKDEKWDLVSRVKSRGVVKTVKARKLWRDIAEAAWHSADPGIQYDTTIQEWHTCPESGRINATNPCAEYAFLDDTACNLASLNLTKFLDEETGDFDIDSYTHAIRLWTAVLEISVLMAQFPSKEIALRSYDFRTLGLGYANLGSLLMMWGIPYDSPEARAVAAGLTAILTGESYATSAEMAGMFGTFRRYEENRERMLRVIRNHRRAAYAAPEEKYEELTVQPVPVDQDLCPETILQAAHRAWDKAVELGEKYGFRNAQVTCIAPTGTIGLLLGCDTTGVEPDFALVKFKKLAGGGYFKIINQSVPKALRTLGYTDEQIHDIVRYVTGTLSFARSSHINRDTLVQKGFTDEDISAIEKHLPGVFTISMAFAPSLLGQDILRRIGLTEKAKDNSSLDVLRELGFTKQQIEEAGEEVCGRMTLEDAPHLKEEHYPAFDCASTCGTKGTRFIRYEGHIHMLSAVQPFVSGSISKTVNMPGDATVEDIEHSYSMGWRLGLKANAMYRDGSKLSQPLSTSSASAEDKKEEQKVVERIVEKVVERPHRVKLPRERQAITRKVNLSGQKFYVTVGVYDDGKPGEIFVTMSQEGTFASGMADAFAKMASIALQYGVPIETIQRQLRHMRFAPDGLTGDPDIPVASSIADFLAQWFARTFPTGTWEKSAQLPFPENNGEKEEEDVSKQPQYGQDESDKEQSHMRILNGGGTASAVDVSALGFTGDTCSNCGSIRMTQNGSCKKCLDCGETTGCS